MKSAAEDRLAANRYGGPGAYSQKSQPWGYWGTKYGKEMGETMGNLAPVPGAGRVGRWIGGKIGGLAHHIGTLFGSGAYKTSAPPAKNSLFKGSANYGPAGFSSGASDTGSIRVRRREYIMDIISSPTASTFVGQEFYLNPGMATTFPWLSEIACRFQTYKFHGLIFEFKSSSGDALTSTNTALGSVMAAVDYNSPAIAAVTQYDFTSKMEILNTNGAIACKPSDCFLMGVECDPKKLPLNELYVRDGTVPSGQDIRFYDPGSLIVATTGMQGTSVNLGELYVVYDVELMMPLQRQQGSCDPMAELISTTATDGTPIVSAYNYWTASTSNYASIYDPLRLIIDVSADVVQFRFPRNMAGGLWRLQIRIAGDSTASVNWPVLSSSLLTVLATNHWPTGAMTTGEMFYGINFQLPDLGTANGLYPINTSGAGWPYIQFAATGGVVPANNDFWIILTRLNPAIVASMPANGW